MISDRINARLSAPLAKFVARMVGEDGLYETPSEYIRDLIRRDMEKRNDIEMQANQLGEAVLQGYRDISAGRYIDSMGDFKSDMALFEKREAEGWK
ncbi:ribbon-helix-helix domain-containing protein [Asticcacaulis benevestitus]|uniref:CopG family transcriptional regulator n=1 Tax=Asticcacaulis benevestitus DSM 16100 = ATCC BAA-896 TaxID=1121022 RepID=V4PSQ4_9CAUL|nr:hypothetical protein [Asticcacaulis benevestitus]ESQ91366.1 hypothetical protein ABENE_10150 [Asticcacaulis benevestitus DSM 16100 = ATCC BAA-896]